jgi:hypothetical protein
MTACRSAGFNESIRSPVVGTTDGEGDPGAAGFAEAIGLLAGTTIGGVCASASIAKKPIKINDMNWCIEN